MAITITSTPQRLSPAYNPVEFTFTSTNATKAGFKYLVDIYSGNTTTALIARQRVPALLDLSGRVDISRILNNFVDVDAPLSASTSPNLTTQSKFDYSIRVGEEYFSEPITFFNASGVTAGTVLITGTTAHQYIVNDVLSITSNTNINGFYTVKTVPNPSSFTFTYFGGIAQPNSGTTQLVPAIKLQFSGLSSSTGLTVFNGVKTFADFINWSGNNFTLSGTSTTKEALTSQPATNFYATPTQDIILNYYISGTTGDTYAIRYTTDTAFIQNTVAFTGTGGTQLIQFKVGTNNLTMPANTIYYDIVLFKNLVTQLTKPYRITLDRRCRIEPLEILFMDRMGSLSSFAFQLRSTETGTINRTQFKQQVQRPYNTYNSYDRGDSNININFDKEYNLNTNFMTEEMSIYFEELLTSPYTWVKMNNQYLACMITDNNFEVVHQKNKRLIQYNVKIKLANSNNINI